MQNTISNLCTLINEEYEALQREKAMLQEELADAPTGLKPYYIREIGKITLELALKRQELRRCYEQNPQLPPAPRPDLVAKGVRLYLNHATRKLGVATLVRNEGYGTAQGPFRIDLAVTLLRGGITTSIVNSFAVPAGIILHGIPVNTPYAALVPTILDREYLTERIEVPLYYRDENPSCKYEFETLVDVGQVVPETNEGNNSRFEKWWTVTPNALQRNAPFVLETSQTLSAAPAKTDYETNGVNEKKESEAASNV